MNIEDYEIFLIASNIIQIIEFIQENNFLKKEQKCDGCEKEMKFVTHARSIDSYSWRCMVNNCNNYKKYISI
ncbi:hypothetical protein GVAV_003239 [Gurleya vavrai]